MLGCSLRGTVDLSARGVSSTNADGTKVFLLGKTCENPMLPNTCQFRRNIMRHSCRQVQICTDMALSKHTCGLECPSPAAVPYLVLPYITDMICLISQLGRWSPCYACYACGQSNPKLSRVTEIRLRGPEAAPEALRGSLLMKTSVSFGLKVS